MWTLLHAWIHVELSVLSGVATLQRVEKKNKAIMDHANPEGNGPQHGLGSNTQDPVGIYPALVLHNSGGIVLFLHPKGRDCSVSNPKK